MPSDVDSCRASPNHSSRLHMADFMQEPEGGLCVRIFCRVNIQYQSKKVQAVEQQII